MPILMSFIDSGLTEYYRVYFITIFQTITAQALQKEIVLKNTIFLFFSINYLIVYDLGNGL